MKQKILLIDDNIALLEIMKAALQECGHSIIALNETSDIKEILQKENFDIVITDIVMPDRDGFEVVEDVTKLSPKSKIIAISGGGKLSADYYLATAKAFGVVSILQKPFSIHTLTAEVEKLIIK